MYCRRCISFCGEEGDDSLFERKFKGESKLNYKLSKDQDEIASRTLESIINHKNVLIHAVCGAGKTELVYKSINYGLKNRWRIGFAIPRRDVVIELSKRLQNAFSQYIVTSIFGGNTNLLSGDILCLTTHQLFRFKNYFDLLILDEIDAFPYKGNYVLNEIFKRSVRGNYILMSATPSENLLLEFKNDEDKTLLELHTRYHKQPIPVPQIKINLKVILPLLILKKLKQFIKEDKQTFIFCPTIEECENLYYFLKNFAKQGFFIHSKCKDRSERIEDFRKGKYKYLVTTAVLERGVTVKNLQVIIYNSSSEIYSKEALIQISGRVGRVLGATDGEIIYYAERKSEAMVQSIKEIEYENTFL